MMNDFVCGKAIQEKDLVEHVNFVIPEWFDEVKGEDINQWLPRRFILMHFRS